MSGQQLQQLTFHDGKSAMLSLEVARSMSMSADNAAAVSGHKISQIHAGPTAWKQQQQRHERREHATEERWQSTPDPLRSECTITCRGLTIVGAAQVPLSARLCERVHSQVGHMTPKTLPINEQHWSEI